MPSTWIEMTNPMTSRCAPPCSMWSGVMIITVTIAAWAQAIATTAAPTAGTSRTHRDEAAPRPAARLGTRAGHDPGGLLGEEQRVGTQPPRHPPGRDDQDDGADGEATGQLGHAHGAGDGRSDAGEVGAGDGPDGGRPHDDRQGAGAVLLGGQVGRGVARRRC